jgi:hypothetical protein
MGLYHSVNVVYGFEIPAKTDIDDIDRALQNQPYDPDGVGYIVVGDCDLLLLATRCTRVDENEFVRLSVDTLAPPAELAAWEAALHAAAVSVGCPDHPAPAWLVIHNYR